MVKSNVFSLGIFFMVAKVVIIHKDVEKNLQLSTKKSKGQFPCGSPTNLSNK
jgi:hypothetical protein